MGNMSESQKQHLLDSIKLRQFTNSLTTNHITAICSITSRNYYNEKLSYHDVLAKQPLTVV